MVKIARINKYNSFPKTSAICFAIALLMRILIIINGFSIYKKSYYAPKPDIGFNLILLWIILLALGISAWIESKDLLAAVICVQLAKTVINIVNANSIGLDKIFDLLAWISLAILVFLVIKKKSVPIFALFFMPAMFCCLEMLDYWFESASIIIKIPTYRAQVGFTVLFMIAEMVGLVFLGLWLKNENDKHSADTIVETTLPEGNNNVVSISNLNADSIERLKQYKELLDSQIITAEEFDTLKKELLKE